MSFVRNTWYVAALADEIKGGDLFCRQILGEPVLLYRATDGTIAAMSDRCPHRFAPLHKGKREGDLVSCPYHGLTFDQQGTCVFSPHGDGMIPPAAKQRAFVAVERHGFIWIWMGDVKLADAAAIPDYTFLDEGSVDATFSGYLHSQGNYQLMIDNILDLSHADFLHPGLLGTGNAVTSQRPKVSEKAGGFNVAWEFPNSPTMAIFAMAMQGCDTSDGWLSVEWQPVGSMKLHSGVTQPDAPRGDGISLTAVHCMTPESDKTTHYFYASRRDFMIDAETNALMAQLTEKAFSTEDKPMIEDVQNYMGDYDLWDLKPAILSSDVAGVRARRAIGKLLKLEDGTLAGTSARPAEIATAS